MSQDPRRHALYVKLQRQLRKEHPDLSSKEVNSQVKSLMPSVDRRGSQVNLNRFTGSQKEETRRKERPRTMVSYAYGKRMMRVYQERPDGSWKWIRDLRKGEEFQGVIFSWHNGKGPEEEK